MMAGLVFDAADHVRFDLGAGVIRTRDGDPLVLVPWGLLGERGLEREIAKSARNLGWARGKLFAQRAATSFGAQPLEIDALARNIDGELAVLGFGRTEIDLRGDALLFRVRGRDGESVSEELADFLGGFLSGYISAIDSEMPFEVSYLGAAAGARNEAVFFAGNKDAAARVTGMLGEGIAPYSAIERLHRDGGRA
jgi:hypothetical protein